MEILGLRAFADNYIWLLRHKGNAVAVDPGDAAPVLEHLRVSGDRLCAVLITHHHRDHIGGLSELAERFNIPAFGPGNEDIPGLTRIVQGGETIEVPGIGVHFDVLDVGGHTRGHIAYYRPKVLFCGDALFVLGCGRLFEGTPVQMSQSLTRIAALPRETQVYCAHEYAKNNLPFALAVEPGSATLQNRAELLRRSIAAGEPTVPMLLGDELDTNPFLRCEIPEVKEAARNFCGHALNHEINTPVEVFAALREWRNQL
ncbi:putative hydroxyacylglutathione hydrolase [Georgfuchsia toluolica]|uniref:Hydroxyacylglutathione hydrolase n=1 Tax=Georgfuchsia toluolica TaxID=424218 RepID=A0A916J7E2_9PROT|nr:hydroxyacylglutathione hydrolase [Georgfuchsia toluolica]CAG4885334.1 putative hydroxyacylglutathione hydrolase [Georgfuchsia toluolica]